MRGGAEDVKTHRWFREINWEDVREKKLEVQFYGLSETIKRFAEPQKCTLIPFQGPYIDHPFSL